MPVLLSGFHWRILCCGKLFNIYETITVTKYQYNFNISLFIFQNTGINLHMVPAINPAPAAGAGFPSSGCINYEYFP